MRAIEAMTFSGYGGLRQTELPKPQPAKDRVLVRVTAAGVTPLEYTVLSGGHPRAKAPLVLGNEGAGVIEDVGDSGLVLMVFSALEVLAESDFSFSDLFFDIRKLIGVTGGVFRGGGTIRDRLSSPEDSNFEKYFWSRGSFLRRASIL